MPSDYKFLRLEPRLNPRREDLYGDIQLGILNKGMPQFDEERTPDKKLIGSSLILFDYSGPLALPKGFPISIDQCSVSITGGLASPASISHLDGDLNLAVPQDSKLEVCIISSEPNIVVNRTYQTSQKSEDDRYYIYGRGVIKELRDAQKGTVGKLRRPLAVEEEEGWKYDFEGAKLQTQDMLRYCIDNNLIAIIGVTGTINVFIGEFPTVSRDMLKSLKTAEL